jgi:hypothetical protein
MDGSSRQFFDEEEAAEFFFHALKLPKGWVHHVTVYPVAAAEPISRNNRYKQTYEYRGFKIDILQGATTVGTVRPEYMGFVTNLQPKSRSSHVVKDASRNAEFQSVEDLKKAAEAYADKRRAYLDSKSASSS